MAVVLMYYTDQLATGSYSHSHSNTRNKAVVEGGIALKRADQMPTESESLTARLSIGSFRVYGPKR